MRRAPTNLTNLHELNALILCGGVTGECLVESNVFFEQEVREGSDVGDTFLTTKDTKVREIRWSVFGGMVFRLSPSLFAPVLFLVLPSLVAETRSGFGLGRIPSNSFF